MHVSCSTQAKTTGWNNGRARGPEPRRNIVGNVRENNEHDSGVVQLTVFIPARSAWGIKSKHNRYLCQLIPQK